MMAVEVECLSKQFRRQTIQPYTSMKSALVDWFHRRSKPALEGNFHVLKDITFAVQRGRTLGLFGRNGSGKSTLLKLIAGIYRPDQGNIRVHGRVGALLELGAGFHPEFSGRENVFINGIVLGLSKREIRQKFHDIVRFAELEACIDEPVKTYSSGMYMRLGFAVAVHADPDILLIDEILAVGDEGFRQKCFEKLAEFRKRAKTLILVSHDLAAVERWCDDVLWLDEGVIRAQGEPRRVIDQYRESVATQENKVALAEHHRIAEAVQTSTADIASNRWGSQEIAIVSLQMLDASGEERYVYHSGESVRVLFHYEVYRPVPDPIFGIAILRGDGLWCYGSNTHIERTALPPLGDKGVIEVLLEKVDLLTDTYYLDVAVHDQNGYPYDYHHQLYPFTMKSSLQEVGVFRIPHRWIIKPLQSAPRQYVATD